MSEKAILNLGDKTLQIIEKGIYTAMQGNAKSLQELRKNDRLIDQGQSEILEYLRLIQIESISGKEIQQLEFQIETVNILESAADLITTDLVEAAEHRIESGFLVSQATLNKFIKLYTIAYESFYAALEQFGKEQNPQYKMISKNTFKDHFQDVRSYLFTRLAGSEENRIMLFRFETEILEVIRRLHALARRLERKAK
jgi:phosphate:Na+ symporter